MQSSGVPRRGNAGSWAAGRAIHQQPDAPATVNRPLPEVSVNSCKKRFLSCPFPGICR